MDEDDNGKFRIERVNRACFQIEEYMEQLDNNKIPRIASPGEKYRDIQLIVQLPKQDLCEDLCRHLLNQAHRKAFEDYRTMRDTTAMDIARVRDYTTDDKVRGHLDITRVRDYTTDDKVRGH